MFIVDLVVRKNNTKKKIYELENYISNLSLDTGIELQSRGALYSNAVNNLFLLYKELQNFTALLDNENGKNEIDFGKENFMSVLDAVHVRKTILKKIKVYDLLISNKDLALDIKDMMDTRDKLLEDFITLSGKIIKSDLENEI